MSTAKKTPKPVVRAEIMRRIAQYLIAARRKILIKIREAQKIKNYNAHRAAANNVRKQREALQPLQNAFDRFSRGKNTRANRALIRPVVLRK